MEVLTLTAEDLKTLIIAGANHLQRHKNMIDQLNVFPVPDGDTGTNMSLTILSAVKEVEKTTSNDPFDVARAASTGALKGARGNSGVILSQLFRGFTKGLEGKDKITPQVLSEAFIKASEAAYKAVMKPKEGTILTVAREIAEKAKEIADTHNNIITFMEKVLTYGNEVLDKTPDMLPVLKQAGVVDAGGKGLLVILEGAYNVLTGKEVIKFDEQPATFEESTNHNIFADFKTDEITFGYCTEFIINTEFVTAENIEDLKSFLETIGDSIVVVGDEEIIKIHVHTDHPGQALEKGLTIGALTNLKIENMREQHTHNLVKYQEVKHEAVKDYAFIAVAVGEGIADLFKQLGVDIVIQGGQTMNPSTEDFLNAIEKISARTIFVLPNNSNIILAAEQAQSISKKQVFVIPSKTIPQGITSMIQFDQSVPVEENFETMKESLNTVKTGQVTFAVRDTVVEELSINQGDIIGIIDSKIEVVTQDIHDAVTQLISKMVDKYSEIITIYSGQDVTEKDAAKIKDTALEKYPQCEVELLQGGQPLYYYILSVE